MKVHSVFEDVISVDPLDVMEDIALDREWSYERHDHQEFCAQVTNRWGKNTLYLVLRPDLGSCHLSCELDALIPHERRGAIFELLSIMNEHLWLGHFEFCQEDDLISFRYGWLTRNQPTTHELLEELTDMALLECERFFPALQYVVWGGKTPREAIMCTMLETVGEA